MDNRVNDSSEIYCSLNGTADESFENLSVKERGRKTSLSEISEKIIFPFEFIQKQFQKGTIKGSIFILLTATCGAGTLSMPQAVHDSGLYLSIFLFAFSALLTFFTTNLLIQCAQIAKSYSYIGLARGSPFLTFFVKFAFFLCNWGFTVAFIVLINKMMGRLMMEGFGDTIPRIFTDSNGKFWACFVTLIYGFPISLYRSFSAIRFTFVLGISFVLYYSFVIVYESFQEEKFGSMEANFEQAEKFHLMGILKTLPIAIFSFTCHSNVLEVYKELKDTQKPCMSRILLFVMVFSFLLYSFVGCFGYLTFTNSPNQLMGGIILLADYKDSVLIKLSLALFCFSLILAFPLNVKPTKEGLRELMGGGRRRREESQEGGAERDGEMEHCIWTFLVLISTLAAALFVTNMSDVLIVMGATINPLISFFFPCMFYFKYANYNKNCWKRKLKRGFAFLILILSFFLMFFGLANFFNYI